MTEFSFTYKHYFNFLQACKRISAFHVFKNAMEAGNGFLLRHDIDFDLKLAKKLLEVEVEADVRSTNFILVSNPAYNILTKENRAIITWMVDHDFEVGLHFDPTAYTYSSYEQLERFYLEEKRLLESVCQKEIHSVSLHCPSIHGEFVEFKDVVNAYDPRIFKDENYLSDSRKGFRNKVPAQVIQRGKEHLLQVLFHPVHFSEEESSYKEIFSKLAIDKVNELDALIRPYNNKFVEELGGHKIIDLLK